MIVKCIENSAEFDLTVGEFYPAKAVNNSYLITDDKGNERYYGQCHFEVCDTVGK